MIHSSTSQDLNLYVPIAFLCGDMRPCTKLETPTFLGFWWGPWELVCAPSQNFLISLHGVFTVCIELVASYLPLISQLRQSISRKHKKSYTLSVGKLNPSKLANFLEIECFVLVACPENTVIDSKASSIFQHNRIRAATCYALLRPRILI